MTYISLFSSAGVGCFGFKKAGFDCIATNEYLEKRLKVQKLNNKCRYNTGYIQGDIQKKETKNKIFKELKRYKGKVDVLIATPPCQGMSTANQKRNEKDKKRNSLVVQSVEMVKNIQPKVFVFENVPAFLQTDCTAPNGKTKKIGTVIDEELADKYVIENRKLNFKNYGSNSSRSRVLVIGVLKGLTEPNKLFPKQTKEKTLREVISDMPPLKWGEICQKDFYHSFRTYPEYMRSWIHDLKEGESAFDNKDIKKRPHKIVNGKIVLNKKKSANKYTRTYFDRVAPCVLTRNDILSSQSTIHPVEDRVFSIRELMRMMTIPDSFKWTKYTLDELNDMTLDEKQKVLKKEERNIRQSIGESVPTNIFYQIAKNINKVLRKRNKNRQKKLFN